MKRPYGFALLELMVVVGILGILAVSAVPAYQSFRSRAVGAEATATMKQILDSQIIYYLEHNRFFPDDGKSVIIFSSGMEVPPGTISEIERALKLKLHGGRGLEYSIANLGGDCIVRIDASFPIFKGGQTFLYAMIDREGRVTYLSPGDLLTAFSG
jgi:prepilin-type N-terminal cleavage/methylation domain-containing protein